MKKKLKQWSAFVLVMALLMNYLYAEVYAAQNNDLAGSVDSGEPIEESAIPVKEDVEVGMYDFIEDNFLEEDIVENDISEDDEVCAELFQQETEINPYFDPATAAEALMQGAVVPYSYETGDFWAKLAITAADVRRQMVERKETITTTFGMGDAELEGDYSAMFGLIINAAVEHTGIPDEGDYLAHQINHYGGYMEVFHSRMEFIFSISYDTTWEQERLVDAKVSEVLEHLDLNGKSNYEKIKQIYGWVCSNIQYSMEGMHTTAYNALINGTCACQGFAVLLYRLLNQAGVACHILSGYGGDIEEDGDKTANHCWNIAEIDGLYYYLDATWDLGEAPYEWFLHGSQDWGDHYYLSNEQVSKYIISTKNYLEEEEREELSLSLWENYVSETGEYQNEISSFTYTCGSFSWSNDGTRNYDQLYLKVNYTGMQTEGDINLKLTAPDGYSFSQEKMQKECRLTLTKAHGYTEGCIIYPVYSEEFKIALRFAVEYNLDDGDSRRSVLDIPAYKNPNEGKITLRNSFDEDTNWEYGLKADFSGFKNPSDQYDHQIAKLSAALSAATYRYDTIKSVFENLGFSNIDRWNYNQPDDQISVNMNEVACIFATKKYIVDDEIYTIVAIAIRGTLENEWYTNFKIGDPSVHNGFVNAKAYVVDKFTTYVEKMKFDKEHTKLLITGHSRAAAVADLLADQWNSTYANVLSAPENMYTYTYAAPNSLGTYKYYNNIFNIINDQDIVTHVPGGFYKAGTSLVVNELLGKGLEGFNDRFKELWPGVTYHKWDVVGHSVLKTLDDIFSVNNLIDIYFGEALADLMLGKAGSHPYLVGSVALGLFAALCINPVGTLKKLGTIGERIIYITDRIWSNHAIETYIAWLDSSEYISMGINETSRYVAISYQAVSPGAAINEFSGMSLLDEPDTAEFPITVSVYNANHELVSKIENGKIVDSNGSYCTVDGNMAMIWLDNDECSLDFIGNNVGTIDTVITEYNMEGDKNRIVRYSDVSILEGETLSLEAGNMQQSVETKYILSSRYGEEEIDFSTSGNDIDTTRISITVIGNGTVFGDGYYSRGEDVFLCAIEEDEKFYGWYVDGVLVSKDFVYSLVCADDLAVEARFMEPDAMGISSCTILLPENSYIFDGTPKMPTVVVQDRDSILTEGMDYSVAYSDNVNAGTASIMITGKGNYKGTTEKTFLINKANQSVSANISFAPIKAGETAQIIVSGYGDFSYNSEDSEVATVNESGVVIGIKTGNTTITVTASGTENYHPGSTTVFVSVTEHNTDDNTPEAEVTSEPTVTQEPELTPKPEITPRPTLEPEPEATLKPAVTPKPTLEPEPEATLTPKPTLEPEPETTLKPEPTLVPEPKVTLKPEPTLTPEPEATLKPTIVPEPDEAGNPFGNGGKEEDAGDAGRESSEKSRSNVIYYKVVRGDTLSRIARMYGITLAQLLAWNPQIVYPNRIYPGQMIMIGKVTWEKSTEITHYYIVKKGDTLIGIAKKHGLSLATLRDMNAALFLQKYIFPGQKVIIK